MMSFADPKALIANKYPLLSAGLWEKEHNTNTEFLLLMFRVFRKICM